MNFLSKIKLYDRYIFKQIFATSFVAVLLFTVIWIAPEMLLDTIRKVLAGGYTIKTAILIIVYEIPNILGKALPVGLLLGSLFTFDKLSKDFELTIFRVAGLSVTRIIKPVIVFSLIVTAICFVTYDKLIPFSSDKLVNIRRAYYPSQYIYTQKNEEGKPLATVVISKFNQSHIGKVIYLDFADDNYKDFHGLSHVYVANEVEPHDDKWILKDVLAYNLSGEGIIHNIEKIQTRTVLQGDSAKNLYTLMMFSLKKDREIGNADLKKYIKLLEAEGLDEESRFMQNKYYQRFTHPFVCVLLAILGSLLGFSKPREQRLVGFTIAIGAIFLYYITLPFFDLLAEKGIMHPLLTASFPLIAFSLATWAFYKSKDL